MEVEEGWGEKRGILHLRGRERIWGKSCNFNSKVVGKSCNFDSKVVGKSCNYLCFVQDHLVRTHVKSDDDRVGDISKRDI